MDVRCKSSSSSCSLNSERLCNNKIVLTLCLSHSQGKGRGGGGEGGGHWGSFGVVASLPLIMPC